MGQAESGARSLHVIARSSATKLRSNFARMRRSNSESLRGEILDCFRLRQGFGGQVAALAMTEYDVTASLFPRASRLQTRLLVLAARFARVLLSFLAPKGRGRREGRVPTGTRGPLREMHAGRTAQQHTGGADHSAFPARWSDGLCRALPGAELSFGLPRRSNWMMPSTRLGSRTSSIRLDRSNDGQDHTVLPYARPAISPAVFPAPSTRPETYRRDEA